MLVHERLGATVSPWQAGSGRPPSPYHFWLRLQGGACLPNPLFLAAAYLPPYRSPYGLKSADELDDYITGLGDEVAEILASSPGADLLVATDWNGHTGSLPDYADHTALLAAALDEEAAEEVLLPCAVPLAAPQPLPRANSCTAAPCAQGKAALQLCCATGLQIANGRVHGDLQGSPTCFSGKNPTTIDYFFASPSLLSHAAKLQVLSEVPEYTVHRPLELWLAPPPRSAPQDNPSQQHSTPESDCCGPPPTFAAPLRLTPDRLSSFAKELQQPATAAHLQHLAATASSDPLQAASQLHDVLYSTAATVFPPANVTQQRQASGSTSRQLRKQHQPWFDAECAAARRQIRLQMQASLASGQPSHLAKEALRVVSNRYTRLRQRKAAGWQRKQGTALLNLQRTDNRRFYRLWKRRNPDCPIPPPALLRHFVNLQLKRVFKPSRNRTSSPSPSPSPAAQQACSGSASPSSPSRAPPLPDPELDSDITTADLDVAFKKLSPSSASLGPLKAALIKAGRDSLMPVLASLFTAVFRSGCFPPEWALGAITPILKKGDPTDPNNYRGITVGHVLGKLYALVINARLTTWLETRGLRAKGQAGFRLGHRTVDNCFVLRALAERYRSRGVKLFLCAVDFEKAFDSVNHDLLWAALRRAGIGGAMLLAVQAMYADVPVCVKTTEGLSSCFQSVLGVKQGCPLSPLLFGIFLDDFETYLQTVAGSAAAFPQLSNRSVPPLLFADDMFLIATSAAGLQAQLRALQAYCDAKHLTVNTAKTQVMILRPGGGGGNGRLAAGEAFSYAGQPLEVVSSVKYLGLTFSQLSKKRGFASCADVLAGAGRQAMFATRRRAFELGACTVEQQCMLFDVFVTPVLSYGCELWGPDLLLQQEGSSVERVHRWFCRRVQGLPRQVSSAVALGELGRQPLHIFWVRQLVRFWNRLQTSMGEPDSLLGWAMADNLSLLREGGDLAAGSPCWCRRWLQFLQSTPTDSGTFVWLTQLDERAVVERAVAAYRRQSVGSAQCVPTHQQHHPTAQAAAAARGVTAAPSPRVGPSALNAPPPGHRGPMGKDVTVAAPPAAAAPCHFGHSTKFAYYLDCIRGDLPTSLPAPHLLEVPNSKHRTALSRFRTSCHDLRIERERYLPQAIKAPRHERTCLQCASPSAIEDEIHLVFHCPIYDHLRFEYADLFPFPLPPSLACFLSQDQTRVAAFIHDCLVLRRRNACMSLAGSESAL